MSAAIGALPGRIAQQSELDASRVGHWRHLRGYMVLASLRHDSNRIKAGVNVVGIVHFGTFLNTTES